MEDWGYGARLREVGCEFRDMRVRFEGRVILPGAFVGHSLEFDSVGGEVSVLHDGGVFADPVQQRGSNLAVLLKLALRLLLVREEKLSHSSSTRTSVIASHVAQIGRVTISIFFNQVRYSGFLNGRKIDI